MSIGRLRVTSDLLKEIFGLGDYIVSFDVCDKDYLTMIVEGDDLPLNQHLNILFTVETDKNRNRIVWAAWSHKPEKRWRIR